MTTSNGKSETSYAPPQGLAADDLLDAWREALGEVLVQERRHWERERALIEAQAQSAIAKAHGTIDKMQAAIVTLRGEVLDMVRARLAEVKDGERGPAGPAGEKGLQGERGIIGQPGPAESFFFRVHAGKTQKRRSILPCR